jgi:hypothetical protein
VVVVNADDLESGERSRQPRVVPPQVAHSNDRETEVFHFTSRKSRDPSPLDDGSG